MIPGFDIVPPLYTHVNQHILTINISYETYSITLTNLNLRKALINFWKGIKPLKQKNS